MTDLSVERVEFQNRLEDYLSEFTAAGTGSGTILPTRLELINLVKAKIDEIIPEGEGVQFNVESSPNISDPYNLFVNAILDEAAKKTLMSAPVHIIKPTDATQSVKQIDTVTLTGTSGEATISKAGGLSKTVTFNTNLTTTASDFVTANDTAYAAEGIVLTSSGADIIFTSDTAGTGFVHPEIANNTGDLSGSVYNTVYNLSAKTPTPDSGGDAIGYIQLPSNFLRLIALKMTDWEREVNFAITTYDPLYKLQRNKYVRGGISKPVAAYNWRVISGSTARVIEYYSVDTNHTIEKLLLVVETSAERVQSNLADALTWFSAAMVLQIIGMGDASKMADEQGVLTYNNM